MDPKEKILQATLNMIKNEGFESITVRKIAKVAQVNVAMINYYFGTKENLLNQVIAIILDNLKGSFVYLDNNLDTARERLKKFLKFYAKTCLDNKATIRRFMLYGAMDFDAQKEYFNYVKSFGFHKVMDVISEITGESNQEKNMMIVLQIMGAIIFPAVMLDSISSSYNMEDNLSEGNIDKYIEILLTSINNRGGGK